MRRHLPGVLTVLLLVGAFLFGVSVRAYDFSVVFLDSDTVIAPYPTASSFDLAGQPESLYYVVENGTVSEYLCDFYTSVCPSSHVGGSGSIFPQATSSPFIWTGSVLAYFGGGFSTTSPSVALIYPPDGTIATTTRVTLTASYFLPSGSSYTSGFFSVWDAELAVEYPHVYDTLSAGFHVVSRTFDFATSSQILWNYNLSSSVDYMEGSPNVWRFDILSVATSSSEYLFSPFASTTYKDVSSFGLLRDLLKTKLPFAYFFQVIEVIKNPDLATSSSTPLLDLTLTAVSTTSGTLLPGNQFSITWHAFGQDTITRYFTNSVSGMLFWIVMVVLWASWFYTVFKAGQALLAGKKH